MANDDGNKSFDGDIPAQITTGEGPGVQETMQETLTLLMSEETELPAPEEAPPTMGNPNGNKRRVSTHKEALSRKKRPTNKSWSQHFWRLDEYKKGANGERGHQQGYCIYCEQASSDDPTPEQFTLIKRKHFGVKPKLKTLSIYARSCTNHLKKCEWAPMAVKEAFGSKSPPPPNMGLINARVSKSPMSAESAASASISSKTPSSFRPRSLNSIANYAVRVGLSRDEVKRFHQLFLEMVVDCCLPFTHS